MIWTNTVHYLVQFSVLSSCFDHVELCLKSKNIDGNECKPEMKHQLLQQLLSLLWFFLLWYIKPTLLWRSKTFTFSLVLFSFFSCQCDIGTCLVLLVMLALVIHSPASTWMRTPVYIVLHCVLKEENPYCGFIFPTPYSPSSVTGSLVFVTCLCLGVLWIIIGC